jgi:4-hydroxy-tetrahydrodipicolinate reductase
VIRVCVTGIADEAGRAIAAAVAAADDLQLASGVSPPDAGETPEGVPVFASVADALDTVRVDVVADCTSAAFSRSNAITALERGVGVVLCTSGLSESDLAALDARARETGSGLIAAESFSLLGALKQHFAEEAGRLADRAVEADANEVEFTTPPAARHPSRAGGRHRVRRGRHAVRDPRRRRSRRSHARPR